MRRVPFVYFIEFPKLSNQYLFLCGRELFFGKIRRNFITRPAFNAWPFKQ